MTLQTWKALINICCHRDYVWDWQPGDILLPGSPNCVPRVKCYPPDEGCDRVTGLAKLLQYFIVTLNWQKGSANQFVREYRPPSALDPLRTKVFLEQSWRKKMKAQFPPPPKKKIFTRTWTAYLFVLLKRRIFLKGKYEGRYLVLSIVTIYGEHKITWRLMN